MLYVRVKCKRFLLFRSETNGRCSYRKTYLGYNQIAAVNFFLLFKGHPELCNIFIPTPRVVLRPLSVPSFPVFWLLGQERKTTLNGFLLQLRWKYCWVLLSDTHTLQIDLLYPESLLFFPHLLLILLISQKLYVGKKTLGFIP